jgi:hypothetical protein
VRQQGLKGKTLTAPSIQFHPQPAPPYTKERRYEVRGRVQAEGYVSRIQINGRRQFLELAGQEVTFRETVPLNPGPNRIDVHAEDLSGGVTDRQVAVVADWNPPQFSIQRVVSSPTEWIFHGTCIDDHALRSVRVDGSVRLLVENASTPRRLPLNVSLPRSNSEVLLEAEDQAGNRLARILRSADAVAWHIDDPRHMWVASSILSASAAEASASSSGETTRKDQLKPRLRLHHAVKTIEVFDEEFFLDGTADDRGGLQQVFVNGEPLLEGSDRGAVQRHFTCRLLLEEGPNEFTIEALDRSGNSTRQTITVIRRIPEYLDTTTRLTVGVPPPAASQMHDLSDLARRSMEQEILRDPARFHLVERQEGWEFIMREQDLSVSDLADPAAALRIGKMLPAELLIMSRFVPRGGGLTMFARVVQTTDGRMLFLDDVYSEEPEEDIEYQIGGLILKIEQRFPVVGGTVKAIAGDRATLDLGSENGVFSGTRFVVVHADPPSSTDGLVRRSKGEMIELEADRVRSRSCVARILPTHGKEEVTEGDLVYAR